MAIQNRTITLKGVFAENAQTNIPQTPVQGVSYRDTNTSASEIKNGWPFKEIVDSAKFNQYNFELSTIMKLFEKYGFLPWSNLTDYEKGSVCLGSNGILYQANQNTGPSSTSFDPVNDMSQVYWSVLFRYKLEVVENLPSQIDDNVFYFIKE